MHSEDLPQGYLVRPDSGTHPGVVMIHDVWGLADHTRDLANRLAEEGFAVLAVDLYRRVDDLQIDDPGAWMRGLSDVEIAADLQAAIDLLGGHAAGTGKVGITGFCMGGMYTLLAASDCRGLSGAVPYYGLLSYEHGLLADPARDTARRPHDVLTAAPRVGCPILGFFGADDEFVPVEDVRALEATLAGTAHETEVVLYEGAGHAFMNDTRPEAYRPEIAAKAWGRMVDFLRGALG